MNILKKLFCEKYKTDAEELLNLLENKDADNAKIKLFELLGQFDGKDEHDIYMLYLLDELDILINGIEQTFIGSGNNFLVYDVSSLYLRDIYLNEASEYRKYFNNLIRKSRLDVPMFLHDNCEDIKNYESDKYESFNTLFSLICSFDLCFNKRVEFYNTSEFYQNVKISELDVSQDLFTHFIELNRDEFGESAEKYLTNPELYYKIMVHLTDRTILYNYTDINNFDFKYNVTKFRLPLISEYYDSLQMSNIKNSKTVKIAAGRWFTALIKENGHIEVIEHINDELTRPDNRDIIKNWDDIDDLFIVACNTSVVGLKKDGSVMFSSGREYSNIGYDDKNIKKGIAINNCIILLTKDGKIISHNPFEGEMLKTYYKFKDELYDIADIVAHPFNDYFVAIRKDGKCFVIGDEYNEMNDWGNISMVAMSGGMNIGITFDNKIIKDKEDYELPDYVIDELEDWQRNKIVKICGGRIHTIALDENGCVHGISSANNSYNELSILNIENIRDIACGQDHTVVLTNDNKVFITTNNTDEKYYGALMEVI